MTRPGVILIGDKGARLKRLRVGSTLVTVDQEVDVASGGLVAKVRPRPLDENERSSLEDWIQETASRPVRVVYP